MSGYVFKEMDWSLSNTITKSIEITKKHKAKIEESKGNTINYKNVIFVLQMRKHFN